MMENQYIADNHNAPAFHRCYRRMGELIPALLREGKQPRIMLEYSGAVLGSTVFSIAGLCAAHACLDDPALLAAREAIGSSLQTLG